MPLLKVYQSEIDALTTRAKFAEGELLAVLRSFQGAPDPQHALRAVWAVQNEASTLRNEKQTLEAELQEAEQEIDDHDDNKASEALVQSEEQIRVCRETIESLKQDLTRLEAVKFDKNHEVEEQLL